MAIGLSPLINYQLPGGAFRLAALLLPCILPVCSVVAPCRPGAALRNLVRVQRRHATRALVSFVSFVVISAPGVAWAQASDLIGVRARGMAGAFTAVADDATATWWNPAGVAGGTYFNTVLEYDRPRQPPEDPIRGLSMAFPALGLSYYRLPLSQIRAKASTGVESGSRQDEGVLGVYGATVGQSLGNHLVLGSTVKVMRAGETHGGLDPGALATFGRTRFGLIVRNVRELEFPGEGEPRWC